MEKYDDNLSEKLDAMWDEHIIACLGIITAWQERQRQNGTVEVTSEDRGRGESIQGEEI